MEPQTRGAGAVSLRHEGTGLRDDLGGEQRGVSCKRADDELAAVDPDVGEAGNAIDVDEDRRLD